MNDRHWRSLRDLREGDTARPEQRREFVSDSPSELPGDLDRRSFLGLMGASAALAGTVTLGGCVRKDVEHILPYADRPEDLIPGKPRYYRTAMSLGDSVVGLHVASTDGRPTKVEGSPDHPMSLGATNRWNQATVIALYDPDRSQKVLHKGEESTPQKLHDALATLMVQHAGGGGLGILVDATPSPTLWRQLEELARQNPKISFYRHDLLHARSQHEGLKAAGLARHSVHYDLGKADVIVALDSDFLGGENDQVAMQRGFTAGRKVTAPGQKMNRLYVAEPRFTVTGAMADNRLRIPGSHVGEFLRGIAGRAVGGEAGALSAAVVDRQKTEPGGLAWNDRFAKFVEAVGADLAGARGRSAIIVGERQPAWVHGLAAFLNDALGNTGQTVFFNDVGRPDWASLEVLAADLDAGKLATLISLGSSPVYDAPSDLAIAERLKKVGTFVHVGYYNDETAKLATWHVPQSHIFEAWGDLISADGSIAVQQPLIAPLFDTTTSFIELVARLNGDTAPNGYAIVRTTHVEGAGAEADNSWRRAIHDGLVRKGSDPAAAAPVFAWGGLMPALVADKGPTRPTAGALEVDFALSPSVLDGRFVNTGWLQELPDPMSKVTWDNCAYVSPATARDLGIEASGTPESAVEVKGDIIEVTLGGKTARIVAWVLPGVADNVLVMHTGYGRDLGFVSRGAGFDIMPLRTTAAPWIAYGASVKKTGERYVVATTQEYGTMVEPVTGIKRPIVRENTAEGYAKEPAFVEKDEMLGREHLTSLWTPPNHRGGQQWGMTIDLNTCTGCNTCTIACQAENNIPIVGKERVTNGREMHWIRIDRYFTGEENEPQAVVQPMNCVQCEMAPCENVCPVAATTHSPEGLNDMAYNRCIGTRYCTNNCPFKVRRFNFFNYNKERQGVAPLEGMQHNPNVTVRFRGIVEKCTYCVQRINDAKIATKRTGKSAVPDGTIVPACAQACPSGAIIFGDVSDPTSAVSLSKKEPRNYELLRELNVHARGTFLAKLRNPNPALV